MSLTKVGIVIGIVISNATVAYCADWFGQRLFDAFAKDLNSPAYEAPAPDAFDRHHLVAGQIDHDQARATIRSFIPDRRFR